MYTHYIYINIYLYTYNVCVYIYIYLYTYNVCIYIYKFTPFNRYWALKNHPRFRTFDVLLPWLLEPCDTEVPGLKVWEHTL